jgi:hypothetical protein
MYPLITRTVVVLVLCLLTICTPTPANGAPLTGAGNHIPFPNPNPGMPMFCPPTLNVVSPSFFTGTWAAPAHRDWRGTFNAIGKVPSSPNSGTTTYDFSGLRNGVLPRGTYFIFGDVDDGSGNEKFDLSATLPSGGAVTTPWLDTPVGVWGGPLNPVNMPAWSHNSGAYHIDGITVPGNPAITFALLSNRPIRTLTLAKSDTNYGFAIAAPCVPEPSSLMLMCLAPGMMLLRRRRRT